MKKRSVRCHGQDDRGSPRRHSGRPGSREDLRRSRRLPERNHRFDSPAGACAVGAREARGDGGLRRGRRRASHRRPGRLRRQLWSRQFAPDQRPLRLSSQPGARPRHRRADPQPRDRQRILPGNAAGAPLCAVQPLLRAGVPARAHAPGPGDRHPDGALAARRVGHRPARRHRLARRPRGSPAPVFPPAQAQRVSFARGDLRVGQASQCGAEGHHPGRCGLRGGPYRADPARGQAERSHRACHARKGVHRVRQSFRRGHDRAARLLLRLSRHDEL